MNHTFKRLSKVIALLMALVMMMSVFAGCKLPDNTTGPITIESQDNGTAVVS